MKTIDITKTKQQEVVKTVAAVLQSGGLVIFPTETVYGAGVDATNQQAVNKLLAFKSRREGKPFSIAVKDQKMAEKYVKLNDQAKKLFKSLLPGPYTIVGRGLGKVAPGVESEFNTLGVRIVDYDLVGAMVEFFNKPITATSANASGKPRPYSVETTLKHLSKKQKSLIDLILDAGELPKNPPSVVIDTTLSTPIIMRAEQTQLSNHSLSQNLLAKNSKLIHQLTHSETETRQLAGKLLLKHWEEIKKIGLVIGLNGVLGAGKTIFAKGVADFLKINELITSPTYNYIEEYNFTRHHFVGKFFHIDVWKVESEAMAKRLEIDQLLAPGHILVIEWFELVEKMLKPILQTKKIPLIKIFVEEIDSGVREFTIHEPIK